MEHVDDVVLKGRKIVCGGVMEKKRQEAVDERERGVGGKTLRIADKVGN